MLSSDSHFAFATSYFITDESLADMQTIINTGSHHLMTKDTGA